MFFSFIENRKFKFKKMKKSFYTLVFCLFSFATFAQNMSENAIGVRFSENSGVGAEISYQRALSGSNRLEANLGIRSGTVKLAGLYEWVWKLDGSFNWYVGAGGGLGNLNDSVSIFGAGVVGVEYDFEIPLQLAFDFRPELYFSGGDGLDSDFGLAVRYQF